MAVHVFGWDVCVHVHVHVCVCQYMYEGRHDVLIVWLARLLVVVASKQLEYIITCRVHAYHTQKLPLKDEGQHIPTPTSTVDAHTF